MCPGRILVRGGRLVHGGRWRREVWMVPLVLRRVLERLWKGHVVRRLRLVWVSDQPGGGAGAPRRCRWA